MVPSAVSFGPLNLAQRLNLRLHRVFLALVLLVAVLGCFGPMLDNVDLGWHIAQGRWMVHHLAFYRTDVLNYPTAGRPVVDEYPLFQVLLYLSTVVGWWGPCVMCALAYLLLIAILVLTGLTLDLGPSATFSLMVGVMLIYLGMVFPLRPHIATFIGIALFGGFLLRHREPAVWTRFWPLALAQIIWTNCHSGFILGPLMVAGFGAEMIVRRWLRLRAVPWSAIRVWSGATALVFLGCFVNPWGVLRFGAPFYQEHLEAIRAYVGEMQPLNPGAGATFNHLSIFAALLIVYVILLRRGAVSWSLALFALAFYLESLQVKKAWPIFGVFLPLVMLSSAAFARTTITRRRSIAWFSVAGHMVVLIGLVTEFMALLGRGDGSLNLKWREWNAGRTELPVAATAWVKQNHLTGRILHRCEDGGWLQQQGVIPTWADTGFGKYDEQFIRETGLLGMRPAMLTNFITVYSADIVICDGFAFQWPTYLKSWRLVFYSPNSSVYLSPGFRPDLPTVSAEAVQAIFLKSGVPQNLLLHGRNLIALHSMGLSEFAVDQLMALPAPMHHTGWYWEAARIICFAAPPAPPELRDRLRTEAGQIGDPAFDFIAYDEAQRGNQEHARTLLLSRPSLSDVEATLLLRIEAQQSRPEALALARRPHLFDLTNGEHGQLWAKLEEKSGNIAAAAAAWRQTIYYAPDQGTDEWRSFFQRFPRQSPGIADAWNGRLIPPK